MVTAILIIEDDPLVSSFIAKGLGAAGFTPQVVDDGAEAMELCLAEPFDLVVLDMGLPGRDGYEVLQELRRRGNEVPVLVLTGRPDLRDVVECLEQGADDYMLKPFHFDELLARVRARLRVREGATQRPLTACGLSLDVATRRVTVGDRRIELTGREFRLLQAFMEHPDQVLSREQLLSRVWGYDFEPGTNIVNVYVAALRKKLGYEVVESIRGVGYRFRGVEPGSTGPDADSDAPEVVIELPRSLTELWARAGTVPDSDDGRGQDTAGPTPTGR